MATTKNLAYCHVLRYTMEVKPFLSVPNEEHMVVLAQLGFGSLLG